MEENSAAVESLILFYINMKHILKTKQLVERVFVDQMVKHCKESGFNSYNYEEIKTTWRNIVVKYLSLKAKGTVEEKENWKYFEIFDSCYEHSDFHNGVYPKFSEEMVWFLIQCFLKRKALKKTQKQSSIVSEVHKEFLQCGYLYITKQDIENKWRNLNLKYDKLKGDPESLKKWPYLQALIAFREESNRHIVNMIFTNELTEILIERFTEKKITCVIHGYDSDQVLREIQLEFNDLGFYFSRDDIKDKWRTLTNVYKFILAKGKKGTTWVHFKAMRNHFKDDFLFPWGRMDENFGKGRRLRLRSKSVGAELLKRDPVQPSLVMQLEKAPSSHKLKNEKRASKKKRANDGYRRSRSRKKLKVRAHSNTDKQVNGDRYQKPEDWKSKNRLSDISVRDAELFQTSSHLKRLSLEENQERRNSADLGSPTSKVHIINIDHSDIDRNNGNLTINLPSITKQFSDNEFLPLKKRLRMNGDNAEKHPGTSKDINDGFLGFPTTPVTSRQLLTDASEDKRLTEEEMREIMERIDREKSRNCDANKSGSEMRGNYYKCEDFNNYQDMYGNFGQQCLVVPKEELQENLSMQNYNAQSTLTQPPVLLLVIKVDGSNNLAKDSAPSEVNLKTEEAKNAVRDGPSKNNKETEKGTDTSEKQEEEQSSASPQIRNDFVKSVSPKSKTIILSKEKKLVPLTVNSPETGTTHGNNSEVVSVNRDDASKFVVTENKQVSTGSVNNTDGHIETNELSDVCTVGENVTVYTTEENQEQKTDEVIFRKPLTVGEKTETSSKPKTLDKNSVAAVGNIAPTQARHHISNGKVRLPVKGGGKLKEIFISPRELNKIAKLKSQNLGVRNNFLKKLSATNILRNAADTNLSAKRTTPEFKFISQVIKPATSESISESKNDESNGSVKVDDVVSQSVADDSSIAPHSLKAGSKFSGTGSFTHGKNEEFENESVLSEAIGDDDGLKDNLLATVIDFQEQNNQEFIEIKNLMKQNNLLQRETNRLLRLMLEKQ